ncbi:recombination mediator RecR [Alphaproteobacteria bacterium endosymbiont of Tiliacea citrago]|uniref:recombination mediator RecR n=1 Tax=Alphaproteobacteria bacterium endosymbiont of Tiliacea citrago TaxID=3077944 RepID=UPI00313E2227
MKNFSFQPIVKLLSLLPSIGPKSARRIAITLAKEKKITTSFIQQLTLINENVKSCKICNNLSFFQHCEICEDSLRDKNQICVVSDISNLWAIENIGVYEGVFHVLESSNILEENQYIENELKKRITDDHQEFILALNPTIEGQATIHYIKSILKEFHNVTVTSLSLGIPIGSDLDYLDSGTITIALESRKEL